MECPLNTITVWTDFLQCKHIDRGKKHHSTNNPNPELPDLFVFNLY